ncbi:MAG: hypothetical protein ABIO94_06345, partial [Opitutaceae bacterium]
MSLKKKLPLRSLALLALLAGMTPIFAAEPTLAGTTAAASLPPLPPPMNVPKPGPVTDGPYQPQPILPGGVVVPLFPPDSPYLNKERIKEAEVYAMNGSAPGRFANITNIHNPSIEFHATTARALNTGMVVILAGGGGH